MIISGKAFFNWQPYVPITFECGVLLASSRPCSGCSRSTSCRCCSIPSSRRPLREGDRRRLLHLGGSMGSEVRPSGDRAPAREHRRHPRPAGEALVSHVHPATLDPAQHSGRALGRLTGIGAVLAVVGLGAAVAPPAAPSSSTFPGSSRTSFLEHRARRYVLRPRRHRLAGRMGRGAPSGGRKRHGDTAGLRTPLRADLARPARALRVDDPGRGGQESDFAGKIRFLNEGSGSSGPSSTSLPGAHSRRSSRPSRRSRTRPATSASARACAESHPSGSCSLRSPRPLPPSTG